MAISLPTNTLKHLAGLGATQWIAYTPSASVISPTPRGIVMDADGTITMTDQANNSVQFTLLGKMFHGCCPKKITACSANVIILY